MQRNREIQPIMAGGAELSINKNRPRDDKRLRGKKKKTRNDRR